MMQHSYLYVPGDRPELLPKALHGPAHAVIVDLEDGVAAGAAAAARRAVESVLLGTPDAPAPEPVAAAIDTGRVLLRLHPDHVTEDLELAVTAGVGSVYVPKAELSWVQQCHETLEGLEHREGTGSHVTLVALVETARGLLEVAELAGHERVEGLALGEADLCAELGMDPGLDDAHRDQLRMPLVIASAAAGLRGPTAPASTDYRDLDGFRRSCEHVRALGFAARSAVHPAQVEVINAVFTPGEEELRRARATVRAFDAAVADGRGVIVGEDGTMVDAAVVRSARRLLGEHRQP